METPLSNKLNLLFVCTGNSCRSQMAEGWTRHLKGATVRPFSAGTEPRATVDPLAVRVMKEAGVDIANQETHNVRDFLAEDIDGIITVCDGASKVCPVFPAKAKMMHHAFADPPRLAATAQTDEERLAIYRRVRDEIREFVESLPQALTGPKQAGDE